jgi:hypothetical protein
MKVGNGDSFGGFAASVDGEYRHVALVALALWSEVFAGVGGIIVATCCHASRWLAVRSSAGATVRINVDMESMVARRKVGEPRCDP